MNAVFRKQRRLLQKLLGKKCPEGINEMFQISSNDNYNLRSNNLVLKLSKPQTNAMKRSFSYVAAKIWNSQNNKYKHSAIKGID